MEAIETESRTFTSLDGRTQTEIGFPKMQGFSFSSNSVEVTIDVQRIVDKQFEDILVEVIDLPDGKEVVLLPNKIGIQVRGGIDILGKLKPGQFNAYVKYLTLVRDTTGSVKPEISLPKNVTLQFTKPDRLRYVIRSY
jgi:YbbR domain-containing protein